MKLVPDFNTTRINQPKLKALYITPKLAYMAKTDTEIVVKLSHKVIILLKEDGTWSFK